MKFRANSISIDSMITDRTIKEITDAEQNRANNETLRSPSINRTLFRTFPIQNYNDKPNTIKWKNETENLRPNTRYNFRLWRRPAFQTLSKAFDISSTISILKVINKPIIYKFSWYFTENTKTTYTAVVFSHEPLLTFFNTGLADKTFQRDEKQDYFKHY